MRAERTGESPVPKLSVEGQRTISQPLPAEAWNPIGRTIAEEWSPEKGAQMTVHKHSELTFRDDSTKMNKREKDIWDYLVCRDKPMTDREIRDGLFGTTADMNMVRPRITELIKRCWIIDVGSEKCFKTHKTVRLVRAVQVSERPALLAGQAQQMEMI